MKFSYQAKDSRGDLQRGKISAASETAARRQIEARGWNVVEMKSEEINKQPQPLEKLSNGPQETGSLKPFVLAVCTLMLVGFMAYGGAASGPQTLQAASSPTPVATKTILLQGVMPADGLDGIHLTCLEAAVQIDPDPKKLARPGQSFSSRLEVPLDSGEIVLEVSRSGRRWVVARLRPQDPPLLTLPTIVIGNSIAINSRTYQSHFAPPTNTKLQSLAELRSSNEERLIRENDFARQHGLPIRNKLR